MNRYLAMTLFLPLVFAACGGGDDTARLRTDLAALQTQIAQPTPTLTRPSEATAPPTVDATSPPTAAPTAPPTAAPQPTPTVVAVQVIRESPPTFAPTTIPVPPTPVPPAPTAARPLYTAADVQRAAETRYDRCASVRYFWPRWIGDGRWIVDDIAGGATGFRAYFIEASATWVLISGPLSCPR